MPTITNIPSKTWICTDPATEQHGRKLSDWIYEFKEIRGNKTFQQTVDLSHYSAREVEPIINAYGYTLEPWSDDTFIFDIYENKETVNWIIAECIFEQLND